MIFFSKKKKEIEKKSFSRKVAEICEINVIEGIFFLLKGMAKSFVKSFVPFCFRKEREKNYRNHCDQFITFGHSSDVTV